MWLEPGLGLELKMPRTCPRDCANCAAGSGGCTGLWVSARAAWRVVAANAERCLTQLTVLALQALPTRGLVSCGRTASCLIAHYRHSCAGQVGYGCGMTGVALVHACLTAACTLCVCQPSHCYGSFTIGCASVLSTTVR